MRWVALSVVLGGVFAAVVGIRARLARPRDLEVGSLSNEWVAQHRADTSHP